MFFISHSPNNRTIANAACAAFERIGLPMRSFEVGDVKVQDSGKPRTATVVFDVRYSAIDLLGNRGTGHTRVEWDVAKRGDSLKIVRSNWMTYPDASPSP